MKAKEKVKALENLSKECNPENEAMFSIYATMKKGDYFVVGNMDLIRRSFYDIFKNGIAGEEGRPSTEVAWAILGALRRIQDEGIDINELLTAFDEDDNDVDDCLDCELFSKCHNERADAWRTILGIN